MANNIFGIILAGGQGTRMGNAERPKQFMEIGKKPIIIHTIEKFAIHSAFDKVIVLSPRAWISHTRDLIRKYIPRSSNVVVVQGGSTRNETAILKKISALMTIPLLSPMTLSVLLSPIA